MRLSSVTLRNYRVHRELTVDFDPARTLIGGPNESGKSTLVEAVHRALFLRARGQTEAHRAMQSTRHAGQPEVEVAFEAEGHRYLLRKRFGGNGTTLLARTGGSSLQGEEAETELARILGVPAGGSKRELLAQWSHLWIWQGLSGGDPCQPMGAQADRLLSRLQREGGAVAVQSDHDARVAGHFAAETERIFTQAGAPRAGSDLDQAETADAAAREALQRATARREQLFQTVREFEDAGRDLRQLEAELPALTVQQQALTDRGAKVAELRTREATEHAAHEAAVRRLREGVEAGERIAGLRKRIAVHDTEVRPAADRVRELEAARQAAADRAAAAALAHQAAATEARRRRQDRDRVQSAGLRLERAARVAELSARHRELERHAEEARRLREQIAALPSLTEARLRRLRELDQAASQAETAWKAMAAELEVVASDAPVRAGEQQLTPGASTILTEETEIVVGDSVRLRIRPGGGTSLSEARTRAARARESLNSELDALGLESVSAAQDASIRRAELSLRLESAGQVLRSLDADRLPALLDEAARDLAAAEADWVRRSEGVPEAAAPDSAAAAREALAAAETALSAAEAAETSRRAELDAATGAATSAADTASRHREELDRRTREAGEWRGQLRLLEELHGDDTARATAAVSAQLAVKDAGERLAQTRETLARLQPELLDADGKRLDRALRGIQERRTDTARRLAVAQAALRSDGAEDPEAEWALATARAAAAAEHLNGVRNRAEALRLVNNLFREEQQSLADQLTRPLANRVAGYLQCLFGPEARASLTLAEGTFQGLHLVRPGFPDGTVPFEDLSGGTREQVAAAVRLAVAEVLAADHGGSLPVVFDDAFAYSDPDRVQSLQRMLDLAALRGLQVIVLTCTPSDYAALGARQVRLPGTTEA